MLATCRSRDGSLLRRRGLRPLGAVPAYWPLLEPAGAIEILAHRVLWSLVTMGVLVVRAAAHARVRATCARTGGPAAAARRAAVVISVNWVTYIWGVNNGRVVETSLGYFINPLVTVLMGVVVLGERLRPAAVGTRSGWPRRGRGADRRLRPAAVGGAGAGVLVRDLRAGQEERERRRGREPDASRPRCIAPVAAAYVGWLGAGQAELRGATAPATPCCYARPAS